MLSKIVGSSIRRYPMMNIVRAFSTPQNSPVEAAKSSEKSSSVSPNMTQTHKVNDFERKILVWTGKYKQANEVPDYINQDVMERARSRFRIRLSNIMMFLTAIGCIVMVYSGKEAAERGESVQKMNMDWHAEYNAKSQKEALEAQQKKK